MTIDSHPLRDRAAIAGVGYTEFSKSSGVSTQTLALRAIRAALDDAGLTIADVDGVACHRVGDSVQAALVAQALGIRDLRFHLDLFGGGSASASVVGSAAMAVATGMAECVVCWRAINARSEFRMGGTGRAAPDTPEFQYQTPYGYMTPPQQFAMVARAYLDAFGVRAEDLGRVAITQRQHAIANERAMMRTPITMDDYLASRWIVKPFRLLDCCLETDAGVALVVTPVDRARDLRHVPVRITGAVFGGGHTLYSNDRGDLTTSAAADSSTRLYAMAGLGAIMATPCVIDAQSGQPKEQQAETLSAPDNPLLTSAGRRYLMQIRSRNAPAVFCYLVRRAVRAPARYHHRCHFLNRRAVAGAACCDGEGQRR